MCPMGSFIHSFKLKNQYLFSQVFFVNCIALLFFWGAELKLVSIWNFIESVVLLFLQMAFTDLDDF